MAQTNWGPAEPIRQVGVRAYRAWNRADEATSPSRSRKPAPRDTSWHDSKVRQANESFRRLAERERAAKRKTGSRPASRPAARKSTSRSDTRRGGR